MIRERFLNFSNRILYHIIAEALSFRILLDVLAQHPTQEIIALKYLCYADNNIDLLGPTKNNLWNCSVLELAYLFVRFFHYLTGHLLLLNAAHKVVAVAVV